MRDEHFEHSLQVALAAFASEMPITPDSMATARATAGAPPAPWWHRLSAPPTRVRVALVLAFLLLAAILTTLIAGASIRKFDWQKAGGIVVDWNGNIEAVDPATRTRRSLLTCSLAASACANLEYGLAWSPDGRGLAFTVTRFLSGGVNEPPDSELGLWILDADNGAMRHVTGCGVTGCGGPPSLAWSPDGSRIAVAAAGRSTIEIVDPTRGRTVSRDMKRPIDAVGWSSDGAKLVFAGFEGELSRFYSASADGSNVIALFDDPAADVHHPAWSPDGESLAYLVFTHTSQEPLGPGLLGHIWIRNADGSGARAIFDATEACCRGGAYWGGPVWSPDGSMLAFVAGNDNHLYAIATTGGAPVDLGRAIGRTSLAWQPVP